MKKVDLFIIVGILFTVFETSSGQSYSFGLQYSYGKTAYHLVENSEELHRDNFTRIGIPFGFSPFLSNFSVLSGMEVELRDVGNYLTLPAALRVSLGHTFKIYGEGGLYYSFLLKTGTTEYMVGKDWGCKAGAGLVYSITKKWHVELAYEYNYGFAESLKIVKIQPFENKIVGSKSRTSYLSVGLKYRF